MMENVTVPLKKPTPDIQRFLDAMLGKTVPEKTPMVEYLVDNAIMQPILTQMLGRQWVEPSDKEEYMGGQMDLSKDDLGTARAFLDNVVRFWYHMGYDYVRIEASLPLPAVSHVTRDTAKGREDHNRAWQAMSQGVIASWEDFERYPWPEVTDAAFHMHEYICNHLPDGLGFITCHAGGVYEHLSRLVGYQQLCLMLYENPDLFKAIVDRLGELIREYNRRLLEFDNISAIFQGEDFGSVAQPLLAPAAIKEHFLPWHKTYARMCHDAGRPYFLHSCGEITSLMDALIDDVKIDGKHSFQEKSASVFEYKKRYGDKIAILGGIDIDRLASWPVDLLRRYVREVIDTCGQNGRFAVGSGNSVTSYVPMANYLAMISECLS